MFVDIRYQILRIDIFSLDGISHLSFYDRFSFPLAGYCEIKFGTDTEKNLEFFAVSLKKFPYPEVFFMYKIEDSRDLILSNCDAKNTFLKPSLFGK